MASNQNPQASIITANSDSQSNQWAQSALNVRSKVGGLNLPFSQSVSLPSDLKNEVLILPSSSLPSWGSYFIFDIREKNCLLHNLNIQLTTAPVSGTSVTGYFNPAFFFVLRCELVISGTVIQTIYGNEQFLKNQILSYETDRLLINNAAGNYASTAQRTLLSSQSANNVFYIQLKTFLDQIHAPLLQENHNLQLRIYLDTLSNVYKVTSGVLGAANILSANLIAQVTRLPGPSAQARVTEMIASPYNYIFHDTLYATYSIPANITSTQIILSSFVGKAAAILFTLRSSTVSDQAWVYSQIGSYAILDSASANVTGGQVLPASLAANVLQKRFTRSQYTSETSFGTNNQNANFYFFAFSSDIDSAMIQGQCLSSRVMRGNDQLLLNFTSATGSALQLDVYCYTESMLEQSVNGIRKVAL